MPNWTNASDARWGHTPKKISWGHAALMLLAWAVVLSPNLIWNLQNQFATLSATGDNIGWVKGQGTVGGLSEAAEFVASQFVVFGPLTLENASVTYNTGYGSDWGMIIFSRSATFKGTQPCVFNPAGANANLSSGLNEETTQARFWDAMLELARQTLLDERSQRTLDLVGGDAVSCIEGDTPILRVGRPLYDRPVKSLQALLDGLGGRRAVVDLRPLAPCGAGAGRGISEVRWPAEVLWVVPPELGALLTPMLDARRCVASLDEAWARLRA